MTQEGTESLITETPGFSICRAMKCSKQSIYPSTVSLHIAFSKKTHPVFCFSVVQGGLHRTKVFFGKVISTPLPCSPA